MADLEYGNDALNIKSIFYGASKMVYVEGDDDEIFWDTIFNSLGKSDVKIESVGGLNELKKMAKKIENGDIDALIARDSDFTTLSPKYTRNNNVIQTYGHSIENSLILPNTIGGLVRSYGRILSRKGIETDFESWIGHVETQLSKLIYADALNDIHCAGIAVTGNNCAKFMTDRKSCEFSDKNIKEHLIELNKSFDFDKKLKTIEKEIKKSNNRIIDFLRGHFLASASIRFVNNKLREIESSRTVNNDSFLSSLLLIFNNSFNNAHPHFKHYKDQIDTI
ncbi:DUF4435 domain-containing protein [Pseudomonas sp. RL_15y_Pfl2_60]|uniref:DUF4435 domain-containing protein n=1 Tax=Pseudomonas sp. RL_15y_Pfl2_60 TaxID=3088709 RepID=UPI0030DAAA85